MKKTKQIKAWALVFKDQERLFNPWDGLKIFTSSAEAISYRKRMANNDGIAVVPCLIIYELPKRTERKR